MNNHGNRRELILREAASIGMTSYLIDASSSINIKNKTITGVSILEDGQIVKTNKRFRVPNVVYDHAFSAGREVSERKALRKLHSDLQKLGVEYVNPLAINNLSRDKLLYSKALKNYGVRRPETESYSASSLLEMIANHPIVCVKPTHGSRGSGIIVVRGNLDQGSCQMSIDYVMKGPRKRYKNLRLKNLCQSSLLNAIESAKTAMSCENFSYLVQEGIDISLVSDKSYHIRALTLRRAGGSLLKPILYAKLGGNDSVGGMVADSGVVFTSISAQTGLEKSELEARAIQMASDIHIAMEIEVDAEIGDLGHDIVFNLQGDAIAIESNVKAGQPVAFRDSGIASSDRIYFNMSWMIH